MVVASNGPRWVDTPTWTPATGGRADAHDAKARRHRDHERAPVDLRELLAEEPRVVLGLAPQLGDRARGRPGWRSEDGTVDVFAGGRKMRVALHPDLDPDELHRGDEVVLNESLNVILARDADRSGEVVTSRRCSTTAVGRSSTVAPTRSASSSSPTPCATSSCAPATRC